MGYLYIFSSVRTGERVFKDTLTIKNRKKK